MTDAVVLLSLEKHNHLGSWETCFHVIKIEFILVIKLDLPDVIICLKLHWHLKQFGEIDVFYQVLPVVNSSLNLCLYF